MRVEELRFEEAKALHDLQQESVFSIEQFCRCAWQHSTPYIQKKYIRFAQTKEEFVADAERYSPDEDDFRSETTLDLLHGLTQIRDIYDYENSFASRAEAGVLLTISSYACCLLGGAASEGDLQSTVGHLQKVYEWSDEELSPSERLELRIQGRPRPLVVLLTTLLDESAKELSRADQLPGVRGTQQHAPGLWLINENKQRILDLKRIKTGYHLYSSLLELVEGPGGTA